MLRSTNSMSDGFRQFCMVVSLVVKPPDVLLRPAGLGPRVRAARTPLTYSCREFTPVPTLAR